jgi:hypothetical protein
MSIRKLAESLKNYEPSHPILIKASNTLIQQSEQIQKLTMNRFNWKSKAENLEKKLMEIEKK